MSVHSVYSFDVFDTCLTRLLARPADVFWVLGENVLAHLGNFKPTPDELTDFRLERMRAEREARAKKPNGEVLLADIYAEFDWLEQRGLDRERGMQAEIETEHDLIRPITAARERIRRARESGARFLFISDMYLPSKVIGSWLVESGMAVPEDPVYVSGEAGVSKKTGDLFRRVAEKEGVRFSDWVHVGDHPVSDVAAPRKLGIRTERWCPAELTPYEERAYCALGDVVAASRLAGTMRCVRVGGGDSTDQRSISNIQCPTSNVQNSGQGTEGSPSTGPGMDISEVGGPKSVVRPTWNLEPAICNLQPATVLSTKAANGAKGGAGRSEDLKLTGERLEAVRSLAADIGAPLLVAFVLFVLRRAREKGVQRLYFLSRRGELPLKIARVFQADFPEIELRYLYSSRWAWRPAAYGRWCRELWDDLTDRRFPLAINALIRVLGIDESDFADEFVARFAAEENSEAMFEWLSRPTVARAIDRSLAERRALVLAYLEQEGLWDKSRIGMVDDGWSGKVQRDLRRLLHMKGNAPDLQGYFFGLGGYRLPQEECGVQHVFLDYDREGSIPGSPVRLLIWRHHIPEDLFMCSAEGRCIGYRQTGNGTEPVLAEHSEGWSPRSVSTWQQATLDFAREWRNAGAFAESAMADRVALDNAAGFLRAPPRELMRCLENVNLRIDVMGAGRVPLIKRMNIRDVMMEQNWAGSAAVLGRCTSYWPEGSLAISGKWVKALAWAKRHGWKRALGRALQG